MVMMRFRHKEKPLKNPQEEADKLRHEAKRHLLQMFKIPEGYSSESVERIVDCIIGAAVLETTAIMAASMSEVRKAS